MGTDDRFDEHAGAGAALNFRPLATLNAFFAWWGEHRAWPANEPARVAEPRRREPRPGACC